MAAASNDEIAVIHDGHRVTVEGVTGWAELSEWQPDELDNLMICFHVCSPKQKKKLLFILNFFFFFFKAWNDLRLVELEHLMMSMPENCT